MLGLVLTAGGARGAYQAGVLKRIGESPTLNDRAWPFPIVTGASAGAINGVVLSSRAEGFRASTCRLADLWASLEVSRVFRTDSLALGLTALRLARDLALGGLIGAGGVASLLDASPLHALIRAEFSAGGIAEGIRAGHLFAVGVSATSYHSGRSFTFIQGRSGHPLWRKSRRVALAVDLDADHVCASAAIPIVFPPVLIRSDAGESYFGDGGLRLVTPLSPAIRLGASRLFAVGVRCPGAADTLSRQELRAGEETAPSHFATSPPPLAQICGVFLNAIFLDHLDADLDHLRRMNELVRTGGSASADGGSVASEPMRIVDAVSINPSADLAIVAKAFAERMPRIVRHVLEGLGTPDAQSADLMSYLLFDSRYTRALLDIGYQDASARIGEIEELLQAEAATVTSSSSGSFTGASPAA
jgi:NTE family protein